MFLQIKYKNLKNILPIGRSAEAAFIELYHSTPEAASIVKLDQKQGHTIAAASYGREPKMVMVVNGSGVSDNWLRRRVPLWGCYRQCHH